MVKNLSTNLAKELGNRLQSSADEIDVFRYALEIILCSSIKFIVIIGSAYLLGLLEITMAYLVGFIPLRVSGGGVHHSTYGKCLGTGLLSTIFWSILAKSILAAPKMILLFTISLLVVGCICILYWVPAGRKIRTSLVLVFILIMIGIFYFYHYDSYGLAIILGALFSFYLMTPMGYKTIDIIEDQTNIIQNKGGKDNV